MNLPSLNYERLNNSLKYCLVKDEDGTFNEISIHGFVMNVKKSLRDGKISTEEKDNLLEKLQETYK